jgi:hypothetical protein
MKTPGRDGAPFAVSVRTADGVEDVILASAIVDASGTWNTPNPLGASGRPAIGEQALADHIAYGIPDVLDSARERYAGKRVLVVGSGHSAFNVLLDLVDLAEAAPGTTITWAIRKPAAATSNLFGGGISDALPARGELGARVQNLVSSGQLRLVTGARIARLERQRMGSSPLVPIRCCRRSTRSSGRRVSARTSICSPNSGSISTRRWKARPSSRR